MSEAELKRRADELLDEALDLPQGERISFVESRTGGAPELRGLVLRLLAALQETGDLTPGAALGGAVAAELGEALEERPRPSLVGRRVGRYRIERELGSGGMARVYLARRDEGDFEQWVALKLLRHELDSPTAERRFHRERQILALARHPNIAQLVDGGITEEHRPYLVMELVDGQPIDRYCDEKRLDVPQRIALFLETARAVEHAHRSLVVHRDIKPSNILVTGDGHVKLLDFGIAKLLDADDDAQATQTGLRAMTPAYAAPEQVRGEAITTATDVYQLGLLLYLLLTGCWPFEHDPASEAAVLRAILEDDATRPSAALASGRIRPVEGVEAAADVDQLAADRRTSSDRLRKLLAGDLDTILLTALRKEPARRYPSVSHLIRDLERFLEGRTISARPDTFLYRGRKFFARHSVASFVAVSALAVIVSLVVWDTRRLQRERDRARLEASRAREVADFLTGLFEVAAPTRSRGEDVTARELVERGATRIRTELAEQPELQAGMMRVIADVHRDLGLYDEAAALADEAVEIRRRHPGEDSLGLAEALFTQGRIAEQQRDEEKARAALEEARALRLAALGPDHVDVAQTEVMLGYALCQNGEYEEGQPMLERGVEHLEAALGPDAVELGRALNYLAVVLRDQREYAASIPLFERGIRILEAALGEEHPDAAKATFNLAYSLRYGGDRERAAEIYERSVGLFERVYGPHHNNVAVVLNNYGNLLRDLGRYDEAIAAQTQAMEIWREALGDDHVQIGWILNNLGLVERDRGDHVAAREWFRRAVEQTAKTVEPDHNEMSVPLRNWAIEMVETGDVREALPIAERSMAITERVYGADHSFLNDPLMLLGRIHLELGDPAKAEPLLHRAAELGRADPEHRDHEVTAAKILEARAMRLLGREEAAHAYLLEEREATNEVGRKAIDEELADWAEAAAA